MSVDTEIRNINYKISQLQKTLTGGGSNLIFVSTETGSLTGSQLNLVGDCNIGTSISGSDVVISSLAKPLISSTNITVAPAPTQIVANPTTTFLWHADNSVSASFSSNDGYAANCVGFEQQPLISGQPTRAYISNVNPKFGTTSFFFDGDTTGYLPPTALKATGSQVISGSGVVGLRPDLSGFQGSTGDFTLEGWFYPDFASDTISTLRTLWHINQSNAQNYGLYVGAVKANISNQLYLSVDNGVGNSLGTTPVGSLNNAAWNHVAIVRSSSTITVYINGTNYLQGSSINLYNADQVQVAGYAGTNQYTWKGYIDEIRISNGSAIYSADFSSPVAAFGNYFSSSNNNCVDQVSLNDNISLTSITASGGFSANLYGTASYATNALTSSFAITASYALSAAPTIPKYGNVVLVDGINGNDSLGVVNGFPFATVNAAINYVSSSALTNTLVYIAPNNYTLTNGITIPATCALRGMSTQTTKLVLTGSGAETTMFTMGENTRIEDLNLVLVSTSSTTNLTGIKLTGTTGTTSKLRTAVLTVDNSSVTASANTNVYGIWCSGSADLSPSDFSFNYTRGVTVNVFSNGGGNKRGIYANTNTAVTFRDTNIYVRAPTSALSTGSYVGVETTNASSSLQFRTTSISGAPTSGSYSGSDIYQYEPATGFIDRGIQLGPGTDLINKTAGARPFTTYVTPTTLNYGLRGNIANGTYYYWNGMQLTADATQVFYRFQQKSILQGMSVQLRVPPGSVAGTHIVIVNVLKSTTGVAGSGVLTAMTASLTDGDTAAYNYNCSVDFQRGEYLALETTTVGGAGAAADLAVQLDLF